MDGKICEFISPCLLEYDGMDHEVKFDNASVATVRYVHGDESENSFISKAFFLSCCTEPLQESKV